MPGADCSERTIPHTEATGSVCFKVPGVTEKSCLKALSYRHRRKEPYTWSTTGDLGWKNQTIEKGLETLSNGSLQLEVSIRYAADAEKQPLRPSFDGNQIETKMTQGEIIWFEGKVKDCGEAKIMGFYFLVHYDPDSPQESFWFQWEHRQSPVTKRRLFKGCTGIDIVSQSCGQQLEQKLFGWVQDCWFHMNP